MNNRGQSLIMFVLVLPLIALLIAFFIDSTLSIMEKNRLDGIITSNIENAIKNDIHDEELIKNAIKSNENMDVLVSIVDDEIRVIAESRKQNVFGKLLKLNYYELKFNYCGYYTNQSINKKCG